MTGCIVPEDSAFAVLARVHANGANITQADVTSMTYSIYPIQNDTAHTDAAALTVSDLIYDTLQKDGRWTKDSTGYNLRHDIAYTVFTTPGVYELRYDFVMADASQFRMLLDDPITIRDVKGG